MYWIGLDVHKKTITHRAKDASKQVHQEDQIGAFDMMGVSNGSTNGLFQRTRPSE